MATIQEKINEKARQLANAEFYKNHPEMVGKVLTASKEDTPLRIEWVKLYKKHGGKLINRPNRKKKGKKLKKNGQCHFVESGEFLNLRMLPQVYVYLVASGAFGYGHVGLILQQANGSYIRYSQEAIDTDDIFPLFTWQVPSVVHVRKFHKGTNLKTIGAGGEIIRIPTKNIEQIQAAVAQYIKDKPAYHIITNNCADFVNDSLNEAGDVNIPDDAIPNDYFKILKELFPNCIIK